MLISKVKHFVFSLLVLASSQNLAAADWTLYAGDGSFDQITPITVVPDGFPEFDALPPFAAPKSAGLAVTPNGQTLVSINRGIADTGTLSLIDVATNTISVTINLAVPQAVAPFALAISPDGTKAYVGARDIAITNNAYLLTVDLSSLAVSNVLIANGVEITGLAITPNGQFAYLTEGSAVVPINLLTQTVGVPLAIPGRTSRIAIVPDGTRAYVTDNINNFIYRVDLPALTYISIPVTGNPDGIAIDPNGLTVYAANTNPLPSPSFTTVDIATDVATTVGALRPSSNVTVTPSGVNVFFSNSSDQLIASYNTVFGFFQNISTPFSFPTYLVVTPDQAPVASFTVNAGFPGEPTTFTSTSTNPNANIPISSYFWNFGDGTTETTFTPVTQHVYNAIGPFLVTLTVTNAAGTSTEVTFTGQTVSNNGGPSAQAFQVVNILDDVNAPILISAERVKNKFLTQTEYVDIIELGIPFGLAPSYYAVYSDAGLTNQLTTVYTKDVTEIQIHKRPKNGLQVYYIISVGPNNETSLPLVVNVN